MSARHLRVVTADPPPIVHPHDPSRRGLVVQYHAGEVNHCPGCGRRAWHVGRLSAECAFCGTALPLSTGRAS